MMKEIRNDEPTNSEGQSELDKFFGPRDEQVVRQGKFMILPNFAVKRLLEGTRDKLALVQEIIHKEGPPKGFRTNISQIETIYPWLLQKEGFLEGPLPQWQKSYEINKPALEGTALHDADALFSVVTHGVEGPGVRYFLPNQKQAQVDRVRKTVSQVKLNDFSREDIVRDTLIRAWDNYKFQELPETNENIPLPGFGVVDSREEYQYMQSSSVDARIAQLASAWAREIAGNRRPMSWEFQRGSLTQREVLIVLNLEGPNLQFVGKLDSISRRKPGGKVSSQVLDLKTGKSDYSSALEQEVRRRQGQMMLIMAERFTARYLVEFKNLEPRSEAFFVSTYHDSMAYEDRVHLAGFRYLDKNTGEMKLERISMTEEERKDFAKWLSWYGSMIHLHREELRALLRKRPNYKLPDVNVRGF